MWSSVNIQVRTPAICLMQVIDPQCWSDCWSGHQCFKLSWLCSHSVVMFSTYRMIVLSLEPSSLSVVCASFLLTCPPSPILSLQSFLWVCVLLSLHLPHCLFPHPALLWVSLWTWLFESFLCLCHVIQESVLDNIHRETCWLWFSVDTGYKAERVVPLKYTCEVRVHVTGTDFTLSVLACVCAHTSALWPHCGVGLACQSSSQVRFRFPMLLIILEYNTIYIFHHGLIWTLYN